MRSPKQIRIKLNLILWLVAMAVSSAPLAASAQQSTGIGDHPRPDLALDYNYLRSNAPPGGCGCFSLNGGSATFAWPLKQGHFALAGDIGVSHTGAASSDNLSLTLSSYTAGFRYSFRAGHTALRPFAQVLAGIAHSSGSLASGQISNSGAAFASIAGGGLDLNLKSHLSVRLVEADYLVTTFDNGVNGHQNNLRLAAGVVLHF